MRPLVGRRLATALPTPFPKVLSGLAALRASGTATGVVTLQDRDRLSWLLSPTLADLLDVVITRQDAPAKPAPDGLHAALACLDVPPANAVFVGDSPADMAAARAAGVLALGAGWGWFPPAALRTAGAADLLPGQHRAVPLLPLDLNRKRVTHPPRYSGRAPTPGALPHHHRDYRPCA